MDIIYPNAAEKLWRVRFSYGNTFKEDMDVYTTLIASDNEKQLNLFADFNGNGQIDHLNIENGKDIQLTFGNSSDSARDVITKFTNGFGEYQEVIYKPLTNSHIYSKGVGAKNLTYGNGSPVFDITGPLYVVSQATSSAPDYESNDTTMSVSYFYKNARVQAGGRGFLGFEKVYSIDNDNGITTGTLYYQDFPFVGKPKQTIIGYSKSDVDEYLGYICTLRPPYCQYPTASIISSTSTPWTLKQVSNGSTNFPYLKYSTHRQREGAISSVKRTSQTVDDYNNVLTTVEDLSDYYGLSEQKKNTTNEYDEDDVDNWILGRLTKTTVVTSRPSHNQTEVPPITRISSFSYDDTTGQLDYEVINPDGSDKLKLITAYGYNGFGNIERKTQCSGHIAAADCGTSTLQKTESDEGYLYFVNRYSRSVWDDKGRYVDETYQGLGYDEDNQKEEELLVSQVNTRHISGAPTQVQNFDGVSIIHGVTTDKAYDAHGRLYFERSSVGSWAKTIFTRRDPDYYPMRPYYKTVSGSGTPTAVEYYDVMGRKYAQTTVAFDVDNSTTKKIVTAFNYDSRGQLHFESIPNYYSATTTGTTYTYDVFGRAISTTHANGTTSSVDYTDEFNVVYTNQIGQTRTENRNALGELLSSTEKELTTTYGYDASGNLTKTTDSDGNDTSVITYDVLGRKTKMVDLDSGEWIYDYNALGQLVSQTDAKLQTTEFKFDPMGRMIKRWESGSGSTTEWHFDQYGETEFPGKLVYEKDLTTGYSKTYGYDTKGRLNVTATHIPETSGVAATDYIEYITFDEYGRIFQQFDASGNNAGTQFVYNEQGYLTTVKDTRHAANDFFYKINEMNVFGKITEIESGNGVISEREFDDKTGLLKTIQTGTGYSIQNLKYNFNAIGRLEWRESTTENTSHHEKFGYDNLNRLLTAEDLITGETTLTLTYHNNGNIKTKSDFNDGATYTYSDTSCSDNTAALHAVKQIGTTAYCYDANGNRTLTKENSVTKRTVTYSNFNKPLSIVANGHTTSFGYGINRQRFARTDTNASGTKTTHYVGNVEVHYNNGEVEFKRSIGGRVILSVIGGNSTVKYLHKDYQGSITAITDHNPQGAAQVVQRMSFDAFGKRRYSVDWNAMDVSQRLDFDHSITTRGYTGHEMLDEVNLIHMNGRTYDAEIGRFMQADPMVQDPGNGQNLNRYSYVLNSPMSYTDPSGYFYYQVPVKPKTDYMMMLMSVAVIVMTSGQGTPLAVSMLGGAMVGLMNTGTARGAAIGAFTAWMMFEIGGSELIGGEKVAVHAFAGGVSSVLQGGKFGHGFMSSVAVSLATPAIGAIGSSPVEIIAAAILGGTISKATGGKFANGAVTSAFRWAYNELSHKQLASQNTGNAQKNPITSVTDKQGNITYTRGKGTVIVNRGVTVKDTKNGNTIADALTVSENIGKNVYIISGHRTKSTTSEHYRVAVDLYIPGQTSATTPTLRDTIHKMNVFNRVASYYNKNTVHVDYKSTGNQGQFHDGGNGWVHIP